MVVCYFFIVSVVVLERVMELEKAAMGVYMGGRSLGNSSQPPFTEQMRKI